MNANHAQTVSAIMLMMLLVGCAETRTVTITTKPADAMLKIDGIDVGTAPVTQKFVFEHSTDVKQIVASRIGYREATFQLTHDYDRDTLQVDLKPLSKRVHFTVVPVAAAISVNGKPLSADPVNDASTELEFPPDAKNNLTTYIVTADHAGYARAEQVVSYADASPDYTLTLGAMKKDLSIATTPAGATVFLDGQEIGISPVVDKGRAFAMNPDTGQYVPYKLTVMKPGYDSIEMPISWDEGKTEYQVAIPPKTKTVRITANPASAAVTIDGVEAKHDDAGNTVAKLTFPPTDDKGTLATHTVVVSKKTADSEWEPANFIVAWENGKTDYPVTLKEILTRPVPMLTAAIERGDAGWSVVPKIVSTIAWKDMTEGSNHEPPVQLTRLPKGSTLDSLAVSPDGSLLLFTVLMAKESNALRSQLTTIRPDGSGGSDFLSDGKSLDLMPSFTPDGKQIVFSSDRAGRRLSVWSMSAAGAPGITQLTTGDTNDLWPSLDSDPKPRLFYQAMVDTRPDPRLFMTQLGTTIRTDLTQAGGMQPRVSPKADSVVFSSVNEKTGKRDIYRMTDKGGQAENLTNSPDTDDFDAAWSPDGGRIAFVSDRGVDEEQHHNFDIWVLDLAHPQQPIQITANGSWDDRPQWDPSGNILYFRSNRGGEWAIWKINLK